jgi:hypothetical protein
MRLREKPPRQNPIGVSRPCCCPSAAGANGRPRMPPSAPLLRGGVSGLDPARRFDAGASCAKLRFNAAIRSITGGRAAIFLDLTVSPFILASISSRKASLVAVSLRRRIETSGPLTDDCASDRDHLGVEIPLDAAELRRPDLVCSAQHEDRHAGAARLDRDHPLAPAERETPEPEDACLGHRRADHPERFLRHRPSG